MLYKPEDYRRNIVPMRFGSKQTYLCIGIAR